MQVTRNARVEKNLALLCMFPFVFSFFVKNTVCLAYTFIYYSGSKNATYSKHILIYWVVKKVLRYFY